MTRRFFALPLLCAALALGGCVESRQAVGSALGFSYDSPDPFNVSPREPLRLPSDFETLPTPNPGAPSPLEPRPQAQARAALAGAGAAPGAGPAPGELALLDAAGAGQTDPAIRATVDAEAAARPRERQFGLTSFLGRPIGDPDAADRLDARAEAERLREQGAVTPVAPPEPVSEPGRLF